MSASLIARPTPTGFEGRFCTDGFPDRMAPLLLRAMIDQFNGDVAAAQKYFIDDHPAGWYRLGGHFSPENGPLTRRGTNLVNLCYCHGHQPAREWSLNDTDAAEAGVEWAYILDNTDLRVLTPIRNGWYEVRSMPWPYLTLAARRLAAARESDDHTALAASH